MFFENTVLAELYKELSIDGMEKALFFVRSSTGLDHGIWSIPAHWLF